MKQFFVTIYFKIKELLMARPKVVRIPGYDGEIILRNFTPEQCDQITKQIGKVNSYVSPRIGDIVTIKQDEPVKVVNVIEMKETAVGLYHDKDKGEYQVVIIKYNPVSKNAKVESMKNSGSFRLSGVNTLKMELVNLGII